MRVGGTRAASVAFIKPSPNFYVSFPVKIKIMPHRLILSKYGGGRRARFGGKLKSRHAQNLRDAMLVAGKDFEPGPAAAKPKPLVAAALFRPALP
jgi:hypothetical protein